MTQPDEREPNLRDVMAAIRIQGRVLSEMDAKLGQLEADVSVMRDTAAQTRGETRAGFTQVVRGIEQVRADIAGVKADTAFVERYQEDVREAVRRHITDPDAHGHSDAA